MTGLIVNLSLIGGGAIVRGGGACPPRFFEGGRSPPSKKTLAPPRFLNVFFLALKKGACPPSIFWGGGNAPPQKLGEIVESASSDSGKWRDTSLSLYKLYVAYISRVQRIARLYNNKFSFKFMVRWRPTMVQSPDSADFSLDSGVFLWIPVFSGRFRWIPVDSGE